MYSAAHDRSHPGPTPARSGGNALAGLTALSIPTASRRRGLRGPLAWGVVVGVVQAAAPLAFPWLPPAAVYALSLPLIAAVYIGFAVADGRRHVLAVETAVASLFVIVAAAAVTGSPWLIVAGTRWWPPFCATVDWVAAALLAGAITAGLLPVA